jgi:Flp pilus assembly protein CpaB
MRKRFLIAAAFSISSMICALLYGQSVREQVGGGRRVAILVAAQELRPGTRITRDHLGVRELPEAYLHPDAIAAGGSDEARVVGRALTVRLVQGQPLLWSDFEAQRAPGAARLSSGIPTRERAVTVPVDLSGSFAGMLRAGDRVDVLGTFSRAQGEWQTVTLLQNVLVLATGAERGDGEAAAAPSAPFNSVTLAVDLDEAELLTFAEQRGTIGFALRGDGDLETVTDIAEKSFGDVLEAQRRASQYRRHEHKRRVEGLPSSESAR